MSAARLLEVDGLSVSFTGLRGPVRVIEEVGFSIAEVEILGVVGESGCGKTTLGRLILRLLTPSEGRIIFAGRDITFAGEGELRPLRRLLQVVFQAPYSSLNPRLRVRDIIAEPLENSGTPRRRVHERVAEVMAIVGLPAETMTRYPHAFSGGQRQKIGIARALAVAPRLIVCDEAVSALDVSIQAQILNLLQDIQAQLGLTLVFISHNLGVVRHISHRIAVMYLGRIVELAPEGALFASPLHPYTHALISAVPEPDPDAADTRVALVGEIPSPLDPPPGCVFQTRCPIARETCRSVPPELRETLPGRLVRCHFPGEVRPAELEKRSP